MADELPAGSDTSEKAVAASSSAWGIVATIIGLVITMGSTIAAGLGADTKYGIIAGCVVAMVGQLQKTLTDLGYINSRTQVKKTFYSES